jgi:hypothetical protein
MKITLGMIGIALLLIPARASAADSVRPSVLVGSPISPNPPFTDYARCGPGGFLVGVAPQQTDRMVGYSMLCVANDPVGRWSPSGPATTIRTAKRGLPLGGMRACPRDYYIVGLGATFGSYGGSGGGLGPSTSFGLIADLLPVCRLPSANPDIYTLYRGYFEHAEDNGLTNRGPHYPPNPRACAPGTVAVGLFFSIDFRRDINPDRQFKDVSLICDRLNVIIDRGLDRLRERPAPPRQ